MLLCYVVEAAWDDCLPRRWRCCCACEKGTPNLGFRLRCAIVLTWWSGLRNFDWQLHIRTFKNSQLNISDFYEGKFNLRIFQHCIQDIQNFENIDLEYSVKLRYLPLARFSTPKILLQLLNITYDNTNIFIRVSFCIIKREINVQQ